MDTIIVYKWLLQSTSANQMILLFYALPSADVARIVSFDNSSGPKLRCILVALT
jgi:hypothetical protein